MPLDLPKSSGIYAKATHQHIVVRDRSPGLTDDSDYGYLVLHQWYHVDDDTTPTTLFARYVCVDDTPGAAVWLSDGSVPGHDHPVEESSVVVKTADETVNNSSTLQDDDVLAAPLRASTVYAFEATIFYLSNATPDFKAGFTVPSGATLNWMVEGESAAAVASSHSFVFTGSGTSTDLIGTGTIRHATIRGRVVMSSTPGDLQLQWAQNTANGSDTKVLAGSSLKVYSG